MSPYGNGLSSTAQWELRCRPRLEDPFADKRRAHNVRSQYVDIWRPDILLMTISVVPISQVLPLSDGTTHTVLDTRYPGKGMI